MNTDGVVYIMNTARSKCGWVYCLIYGVLCVRMNKGQVHGETVQEEQFNVRVTENKTIGGERQMNKSSLAALSG